MGFICRLTCRVLFWILFLLSILFHPHTAVCWTLYGQLPPDAVIGSLPPWQQSSPAVLVPPMPAIPPPMLTTPLDYLVKLAYGRTFGTSTELDYATLEISKSLSRYPAWTHWGPAQGEIQMALLASYVVYYEGNIERLKKLNYRDGYELAWLPKGRFSFIQGFMGMKPYLESGAGLSYVSETYRNSGSRWNWSLLGGGGLESCLPGGGSVALGLQWRHLSNGNMWGTGDELHNSNSGTDMVQGMISFLRKF